MIILHIAPIHWTALNGLTVCVPRLAAAQNRLAGVRAALGVSAPDQPRMVGLGYPTFTRRELVAGHAGLNLPSPFDRPDLVVFHSTYVAVHATIAARLRHAGIGYILCPHGGLTQAAARHKYWKRKIADLVFFRRYVRHARAMQCLTESEAATSRHWRRPVFIVGNGVDLPPSSAVARPGRAARLRLVFIGRLAIEHKGLDLLLDACAMLRSRLRQSGARVELYGPDWCGSGKMLGRRIAEAGLTDVVSLAGPITGDAKREVLGSADIFLHTSRWEGHPVAALEALAHGVPCLLTPQTNIAHQVAEAGAGWEVGPEPVQIAAGLERVLRAPPAQLAEAGARARQLAVERLGWDSVAAAAIEQYGRWIRPRSDNPRADRAA